MLKLTVMSSKPMPISLPDSLMSYHLRTNSCPGARVTPVKRIELKSVRLPGALPSIGPAVELPGVGVL